MVVVGAQGHSTSVRCQKRYLRNNRTNNRAPFFMRKGFMSSGHITLDLIKLFQLQGGKLQKEHTLDSFSPKSIKVLCFSLVRRINDYDRLTKKLKSRKQAKRQPINRYFLKKDMRFVKRSKAICVLSLFMFGSLFTQRTLQKQKTFYHWAFDPAWNSLNCQIHFSAPCLQHAIAMLALQTIQFRRRSLRQRAVKTL